MSGGKPLAPFALGLLEPEALHTKDTTLQMTVLHGPLPVAEQEGKEVKAGPP